ncbi:unnamed protein product [Anisakis simplex]|uniref:Death domain-associated protein 6 n=1 Tax=Anisakis simplex TaxID=6269 RepID=A0A0M3KA30_ANISI|nr:unnamed protein product [Anisakis simplex]
MDEAQQIYGAQDVEELSRQEKDSDEKLIQEEGPTCSHTADAHIAPISGEAVSSRECDNHIDTKDLLKEAERKFRRERDRVVDQVKGEWRRFTRRF